MPTVAIAIAVLVVLVAVALLRGRSARDDALAPVRLGPAWSPSQDVTAGDRPQRDPEAFAARVEQVAATAQAPSDTVRTVLEVWDEYLAVLGLTTLPADHQRRVYDPYDPPVARRGKDGRPVPDADRVARDVAGRIGIGEERVREILAADRADAPRADAPADGGPDDHAARDLP